MNSRKNSEYVRFSDSIKKSESDYIFSEENYIDNSNHDYVNSDTIFPSETNKNHLRSLYIIPDEKPYIPIQMHYFVIYFIFNLSFSIIFIGCITFIFKTIIQKDHQLVYGMMESYSKFIFFPLLCAFILSLLGEIKNSGNLKEITY